MAGKNFWERIVHGFDLDMEGVPGVPLIELYGDRRVLIENHCGVMEYSCETIRVKVKNGQICVSGQGLELALMSRERLIISGRIDSVSLDGRGPNVC